ncbi:unnamed protein product, partial [Discosporangium mesarthrocarpum]
MSQTHPHYVQLPQRERVVWETPDIDGFIMEALEHAGRSTGGTMLAGIQHSPGLATRTVVPLGGAGGILSSMTPFPGREGRSRGA